MIASALARMALLRVHTGKLGLEALRKGRRMDRSEQAREGGRASGWTPEGL